MLHDLFHIPAVQRFPLQQEIRDHVQFLAVRAKQVDRVFVRVADDAADFLVDLPGRFLAEILRLRNVAAEKNQLLPRAEGLRTERIAHAPIAHHHAGEARRFLEIALRPRRDFIIDHFFGGAAAHQAHQHRAQAFLALRVAVLLRQLHGGPERGSARNDRDLVQRLGIAHQLHDDRVTRLVVGRELFLFVVQHPAAALPAPTHLVAGFLEIFCFHGIRVAAGGKQRRLVHEVGEIRTREARRSPRDAPQIHVGGQLDPSGVDPQDRLAALQHRHINHDLPVETAGPEQRLVQHVGPVRGGDDDNAFLRVETVHFHQQRIQRLLALVVAPADAAETTAAHRVDFINEDDARCVLLALLEHVAHARGADADEHLHEVRTADAEERHLRFTRNRLRQQRLARARLADQQDALGDAASELLKPLGILQELDDLLHFLLGLVHARNVREGHLVAVPRHQARAALPEAHRAAARNPHLPHEKEIQQPEDQQERDRARQDLPDVGVLRLELELHALVAQKLDEIVVDRHNDLELPRLAALRIQVQRFAAHEIETRDLAADKLQFPDLALLHQLHEIRAVRDFLKTFLALREHLVDGKEQREQQQPKREPAHGQSRFALSRVLSVDFHICRSPPTPRNSGT
ncbi:MAG: hypothetical protein BWY59_00654 [Verrucomicrobia bacterium ADurb.Bin345]|nr:MAG: hypothetical protein BWY59_00654 [Verrucomicrobia bacterium ADurb.Bin345]